MSSKIVEITKLRNKDTYSLYEPHFTRYKNS